MLTFLLLSLLSLDLSGKVIYITDGDTFHVLINKIDTTIRLHAVDSPEPAQPFSAQAKNALADKVKGKIVSLKTHGKNHDRYVADVTLNGESINEFMVAEGLAWNSPKYSKSQKLIDLQNQAKEAKKGLWADKNPEAPWDYRERMAEKRKQKRKGKKFGN